MKHRGADGRLLDGKLGEGGPHEHVTAHIDQHSLPGPLVEHPELGIACHRVLRAHKYFSVLQVLTFLLLWVA